MATCDRIETWDWVDVLDADKAQKFPKWYYKESRYIYPLSIDRNHDALLGGIGLKKTTLMTWHKMLLSTFSQHQCAKY